MKLPSLVAIFLLPVCFGHQSGQIETLRRTLLSGYEKDAKPDGQVEVKFGIRLTGIDLCPHRQVISSNGM